MELLARGWDSLHDRAQSLAAREEEVGHRHFVELLRLDGLAARERHAHEAVPLGGGPGGIIRGVDRVTETAGLQEPTVAARGGAEDLNELGSRELDQSGVVVERTHLENVAVVEISCAQVAADAAGVDEGDIRLHSNTEAVSEQVAKLRLMLIRAMEGAAGADARRLLPLGGDLVEVRLEHRRQLRVRLDGPPFQRALHLLLSVFPVLRIAGLISGPTLWQIQSTLA